MIDLRSSRRLPGFLSLFALAFLLPSALFAQGEIRFEATPAVIHPGDTVSVEVYIDRTGPQMIAGGEIGLEFDTTQFTLTGFETPDQVAGALVPDLFSWNGPPPIGAGGVTGCSLWWDGLESDAIAATFAYTSGTAETSFLLFRFELTASTGATIGLHSLGEPPVDLTCLWSGSMLVNLSGGIVPTVQLPFEVTVSDVLEPTGFACTAVVGTAQLSWQNAQTYDSFEIFRDGVSIVTPGGLANSFEDVTVILGETYEYTLIASFAGVASPPVTCTVTVTLNVPAPTDLTCSDVGEAVDLTWQLPAVTYDQIELTRDGVVIANLGGTDTSFTDDAPPIDVPTTYSVRGAISGVESSPSSCTLTVATVVSTAPFVRGAINAGSDIDLSDAVYLLMALFAGGSPILCDDAADTNDDGLLNVADGVYLLTHLFSAGPPPPPPFDAPGVDPTPDGLGCGTL